VTTRGPDDLRDPRLDAAWRAASRDEPPPALDDAIRAAARREIGAGPRRADAPAAVPEALRPERWWWPLAAAATIGAIAIGLLQLAGPDHVAGTASDKAIVSDLPAAPAKATKQDAAPREETRVPAAPPVTPAAPAPAATPPPAASGEARERVAPVQAPAADPPGLRKDAAAVGGRDERIAANSPAPPPPAGRAEPERQSTGIAKPAPPIAEPFPADMAKRESKDARADAVAPSVGAVASPPAAAPPAEADAAGYASGKLAQAQSTAGAPKSQPTRRAQESVAARAPAPAALADAAPDARAKVAPKLPVPDWIALIRRLRDEGRIDEATKELAAFRDAYADHERLLPPDLRAWKPAPR
jgi:hypothetical protein